MRLMVWHRGTLIYGDI